MHVPRMQVPELIVHDGAGRSGFAIGSRSTDFDGQVASRSPGVISRSPTLQGASLKRTVGEGSPGSVWSSSSRQMHRTGDEIRRLAPLQPPGGSPVASPRTARPVMPHLAHNHNFGWHPPAGLQTVDAFYGSGWSSPRTLDIEHVASRAPHPLLPGHSPRPLSMGARAISVSSHCREHVHLADNRARNAYIRPHSALRRLAAEQERGVVGDHSPRTPSKADRALGLAGSPRTPRSPHLKVASGVWVPDQARTYKPDIPRSTHPPSSAAAPSPRLQLISWPGHSCFVKCKPAAARPRGQRRPGMAAAVLTSHGSRRPPLAFTCGGAAVWAPEQQHGSFGPCTVPRPGATQSRRPRPNPLPLNPLPLPFQARPPSIDSRELRRGDFTLMQRGMMEQHHGDLPREHICSARRLKLPR